MKFEMRWEAQGQAPAEAVPAADEPAKAEKTPRPKFTVYLTRNYTETRSGHETASVTVEADDEDQATEWVESELAEGNLEPDWDDEGSDIDDTDYDSSEVDDVQVLHPLESVDFVVPPREEDEEDEDEDDDS